MDKNLIMTRCRKVYMALQNNKIFAYDGAPPGEYEFVNAFREERFAERAVKHRKDQPNYEFDHSSKKTTKHEVGKFYLVPASLIETP